MSLHRKTPMLAAEALLTIVSQRGFDEDFIDVRDRRIGCEWIDEG
jgi:hypothetical protein